MSAESIAPAQPAPVPASARAVAGAAVAPTRFIVCVDFGPANMASTVRALEPHARHFGARLIPVDTSAPVFLRDGTPVNAAFEFSGYQHGLEQALALAEPAGPAAPVAVAFVNRTAITSHVRPMLRHALRQAFAGGAPDGLAPRLRGFRHRCGPLKTAVAVLGYYVPTFAFSLAGPLRQVAPVSLYDRTAVGAEPLALKLGSAGADYGRMVDRWLSPTSLLRGWYQALPGRPIDDATRYRKSLAIYLEHALPSFVAAQGVVVDGQPAGRERLLVDGLMWMDKAFVNLLKLRHRLPAVCRDRLRRSRRE
jgi:hypothetical protein